MAELIDSYKEHIRKQLDDNDYTDDFKLESGQLNCAIATACLIDMDNAQIPMARAAAGSPGAPASPPAPAESAWPQLGAVESMKRGLEYLNSQGAPVKTGTMAE